MKSIERCLWVFTALLLTAGTAVAAEKASRPCTKADLIGTWEMVSVKPILDKTDPVFFPYQRAAFGGDSSMKIITSDKPFTQEWLDKFQRQMPEIDFSLTERGLLTMTWQSRPHNETAICAYVLSDVPPQILAKLPNEERGRLPKKGNMTLSYLNSEGKISYQKIFKKIG